MYISMCACVCVFMCLCVQDTPLYCQRLISMVDDSFFFARARVGVSVFLPVLFVCACVYLCMCMCVLVCVCMCAYVCVCACLCICLCVWVSLCVYGCSCTLHSNRHCANSRVRDSTVYYRSA